MTKKDRRYQLERGFWMGADLLARALEPLWFKLCGEKYNEQPISPPIFILGAPRSGTTLIYQALIYYFDLAYMTNLMAELYHAPYLATAFSKFASVDKNFDSTYGKTKGLWGPHEAGEFWYQWFPRAPRVYVGSDELSPSAKKAMQNTLNKMSQIAGQPIVFKNTFHTMRIAPLLESFPNAVFIVCHRDPADISQSILQGRLRYVKDPQKWWAVPPKEYEEIKNHPFWEQIVEQVYFCYRQIDQDRRKAPNQFFDLCYEEFCLAPNETLGQISEQLSTQGINITKKKVFRLKPFIMRSHKVDQRILKKVKELWR